MLIQSNTCIFFNLNFKKKKEKLMNRNTIADLLSHIEELIEGEFFESSRDLCSVVLSLFSKNSESELDLKVITMKLYGDAAYGLEEYERALV